MTSKKPKPIDIDGETEKALKLFDEGQLFQERNGWLSLAETAMAFLLDENERLKDRIQIAKQVKKNLKDIYSRIHFGQMHPVNPDSLLTVDDGEERNESGLFTEQEPTNIEITWLVSASDADRWHSDYDGTSFNPTLVETFDPNHKRYEQGNRTVDERINTNRSGSKKTSAKPDNNKSWKMEVQSMAAEKWIELLEQGATPSRASISEIVAKNCREIGLKTTQGNGPPSVSYLKQHVLSGNHWTPPKISR